MNGGEFNQPIEKMKREGSWLGWQMRDGDRGKGVWEAEEEIRTHTPPHDPTTNG